MATRKTIGQLASGDLVSFPGAFRTTNGDAPNNKQFSVFVRLSKKLGEDYTTFLWAHYVDSLDTIPGTNGAPDGNSKYVSLPSSFNQEDYGEEYDFNGIYKLLNGSVQNLLLFKYLNSTEADWISSTGYDYDKAAPNKKIPYAQKGAPSFLNGLTDTQTALKALKPIKEDVYCNKGGSVKTFFTLLSQEELEYIKSDYWFGRGGKPYFPGLENTNLKPFNVLTSEVMCPDKLYYKSTALNGEGTYNGKNATALYRMRLYNDTIVEYNEKNKIWYVVEAFEHLEDAGYYIQDGKQKVIKSIWVQKDGKLRRYINKVRPAQPVDSLLDTVQLGVPLKVKGTEAFRLIPTNIDYKTVGGKEVIDLVRFTLLESTNSKQIQPFDIGQETYFWANGQNNPKARMLSKELVVPEETNPRHFYWLTNKVIKQLLPKTRLAKEVDNEILQLSSMSPFWINQDEDIDKLWERTTPIRYFTRNQNPFNGDMDIYERVYQEEALFRVWDKYILPFYPFAVRRYYNGNCTYMSHIIRPVNIKTQREVPTPIPNSYGSGVHTRLGKATANYLDGTFPAYLTIGVPAEYLAEIGVINGVIQTEGSLDF